MGNQDSRMDVPRSSIFQGGRNGSCEESEISGSDAGQFILTSYSFPFSSSHARIKRLGNSINGLISRSDEKRTEYEEINARYHRVVNILAIQHNVVRLRMRSM